MQRMATQLSPVTSLLMKGAAQVAASTWSALSRTPGLDRALASLLASSSGKLLRALGTETSRANQHPIQQGAFKKASRANLRVYLFHCGACITQGQMILKACRSARLITAQILLVTDILLACVQLPLLLKDQVSSWA